MKTIKQLAVLAIFALFATACSDDDPIPVNEEEVITTLTVTLVPTSGSSVTLKSFDLDGTDGPNAPTITPSLATLAANTTYTGTIKVENETETPTEDVTLEVLKEDDEHQFFYSSVNGLGTFTYNDMDDDGNPIGVKFTMTTGAAGSGSLTFTLIHEPLKNANGVKEGNIANAGGETDVEATFNVSVQ